MKKTIILSNIQNQADLQQLKGYLEELYREVDPIYTEADPNGVITARRGRMALCFVTPNYYISVNCDGGSVWKKTANLS